MMMRTVAVCVCMCVCEQVAQQEAQRAQFIVEKAKQERQQKVVQSEGEAAAAKMVRNYRQYSDTGLMTYVDMAARVKICKMYLGV